MLLDDERLAKAAKSDGGASAHVAEFLRLQIFDGVLEPGQRIRQELIAQATGSSRLPVREALRTLQGEGLVTLEPNKGARVTRLSMEELDLLYATRAAIEPLVIADSIRHMPDETIEATSGILDRIESGVDAIEFLLLDRDFHLLTYSACSSVQLLSIVERLWNATQQYRRAFVHATLDSWADETNAEHRLIQRAIEARTPEVASLLIASHITRTQVTLKKNPHVLSEVARFSGN